jgi:hypothetical protein
MTRYPSSSLPLGLPRDAAAVQVPGLLRQLQLYHHPAAAMSAQHSARIRLGARSAGGVVWTTASKQKVLADKACCYILQAHVNHQVTLFKGLTSL